MKGKIKVIGTGPGNLDHITPAVKEAIEKSEVVVGYKTYLGLIEDLIEGKEIISNGMKQEIDRCTMAVKRAREGAIVVVISGGDAGVYGLAGLVLELLEEEEMDSVEILPGVTSATACASLLGAPLIHDFAVISLSNLLTDADLIRTRLELAARGDFVTVLYNPKSKKRTELFFETSEIFLKHRKPETPVGLVKEGYRQGQTVKIVRLDELSSEVWVDMTTTIIIGNSSTICKRGKMITPRGYLKKYTV